MLDFRLETFLILCNELNFTKTAEKLHITQPNVSQHIKFLEDYYTTKLFKYENRKLTLTSQGEDLYEYATRLKADSIKIKKLLNKNTKKTQINFGATLTIGEYIMPNILNSLDYNKFNLSMKVENTENLLNKLEEGKIDFAIVEGHFDKSKYESHIFSREKFIGVGSTDYKDHYQLESLLKERIILREKGSGTREIFEQILFDNNLKLESFTDLIEIGNMNTIKKLVKDGFGISFLYERAAKDYIENKSILKLKISSFNIVREFNFVFLKNSNYRYEYLNIYDHFLDIFLRKQALI